MNYAYLLFFEGGRASAEALRHRFYDTFADMLAALPGAPAVSLYGAVEYRDPYVDDEVGPDLLVRVEFAERSDLDAALAGPLAALDLDGFMRDCGYGGRVSHEAMRRTRYAVVDDPEAAAPPAEVSYHVLYSRSAPDVAAFVRHYEGNHPPILGRLPNVRSLTLFTPVEWASAPDMPAADLMLICDVSFDSPEALDAALASDVRHELRRDYEGFPRFDGPVTHQAMRLHRPGGSSGAG